MSLPRPGADGYRSRHSFVAAMVVGAFVALSLAPPAQAHEYWLTPAHYRSAAGEMNSVSAFVGTGFRGEAKPYATTRSVRFVLAAARTVDLSAAAVNGDLTWASFETPDAGGAIVAYQSNFATIELPADEFDAYLKLGGLTEPLATRARLGAAAGPGRERYARCPKTWIAGASPARAMKPVSLPIEIVPLADPSVTSPLPVRVLWHGQPLAGALVRAWNSPLDSAWTPRDAAARDSVGPSNEAMTDARGEALVTLTGPGEWMIGAVHMVPCAERSEADWESWWASFTFARAAKRR